MASASRGTFVVIQADDEPWESTDRFGLPGGMCRVYKDGANDGVRGIIGTFPPGYVEPEHVHEDAEHWSVVIDGEMHVAGKVLTRGGYIHAPRGVRHGPLHYLVGCTIFSTVRGGRPDPLREPGAHPTAARAGVLLAAAWPRGADGRVDGGWARRGCASGRGRRRRARGPAPERRAPAATDCGPCPAPAACSTAC